MSLYGVRSPFRFDNFGGGLCLTKQATQLRPDQAADAQNVDLEEEYVRKRLGKAAYNGTTAEAAGCIGAGAYYPPTGGARTLALATPTKVWGDANQDGDFGDAGDAFLSGLTTGTYADFIQYRDKLFIAHNGAGVYKWTGSSTPAAVALVTAPAAAPTVAAVSTQVETFDDYTVWTESPADGDITPSNAATTDSVLEGTAALLLTATGGCAGVEYKRTISGGTQDLSKVEELSVWVKGNRRYTHFQIGISPDGSTTIDYSDFPVLSISERNKWIEYRIPLTNIAPAQRTAVSRLGIRIVDTGGQAPSSTNPMTLYFDDMRAVGPFHKDLYFYYYTYAEIDSSSGQNIVLRESNPYQVSNIRSPLKVGDGGSFQADMPPAISKIRLTLTYTNQSGITHLRIWRHRSQSPFSQPRLIDTIANVSGTGTVDYDDAISEWTIVSEDRPELVSGKIAPPLANTYASDGASLWCGDVTMGGTRYPWRICKSQTFYPEVFGSKLQVDQIEPIPTEPGFFDLSTRDTVRRLFHFKDQMLAFCDSGVYSIQGSGWTDFSVQQRTTYGCSARNAVAAWGDYLFFLAGDGLRVLVPNASFEGSWECWRVDEPVETTLRAISAAYRADSALGVDERGRIVLAYVRDGQTVSDRSIVFDPSKPGALARLDDSEGRGRPGWGSVETRGAKLFFNLKRGYTTGSYVDQGQLIAADPSTGKLWYFNRSSADAEIETDDGSAIAWYWTSPALDIGEGSYFECVYGAIQADAANGRTVTGTWLLNGVAHASTIAFALTSVFGQFVKRCAAAIRAQRVQLKLSGSDSVAVKIRSVTIGAWRR